MLLQWSGRIALDAFAISNISNDAYMVGMAALLDYNLLHKMNSWLETIAENLVSKVDKVPKEFKTVRQIAVEIGLGVSQTSCIIRNLVAKNKAVVQNFTIQTGSIVRRVPHYKIK